MPRVCVGTYELDADVVLVGFAYDRNWMVVKQDKGKFMTQRQEPRFVPTAHGFRDTSQT